MTNNINNILEKYFNGETSLQEEEVLRKYFSGKDVADEHQIYAPMFAFFSQERNTAPTESDTTKLINKRKKLPYFLWIGGVAASIALFLAIRVSFSNSEGDVNKSIVYIDGRKISDMQTINSQALISIENVSYNDEETINTQIDILDSFTQ